MNQPILATSAVTGAASVIIAPAVISAIGFGSGGIVAGSAAASMMSAAAIAGGTGGVAAGSAVAVLQSAGAAGIFAGPVGWIVLGVGLGLGASVGLIVKSFISGIPGGRRFAGTAAPPSAGNWTIGTEEGVDNVLLYVFSNEEDARAAFHKIWPSRILYNPQGDEVISAGGNGHAIETVRRVIQKNSDAEKYAMSKPGCGPLAGCIVGFKTANGRYLSAHPNGALMIESNLDAWETFRLYGIKGQCNKYAVRSVCHEKRFIQTSDDNIWNVNAKWELRDTCDLTFEKGEKGQDCILIHNSSDGKYLSVSDSSILAVETPSTESEQFQVVVF